MPNHIRNRLIIKADESKVKEILDFIAGEPDEDGCPCYINFNKIIPMPADLNVESGSRGEMGEVILSKKGSFAGRSYEEVKEMFTELSPEEQEESLKIARIYRSNRKKYGHSTWYGWCNANWGTKWNAYHQEKRSDNEIWFETAWSCVIKLIGKLSEKYPHVTFNYTWADEDTGCNCGQVIIKNGKGWINNPDDQSKEAYEIAYELWPECKGYRSYSDPDIVN